MTDVKQGDRVRVVLEGEIRGLEGQDFVIGQYGGDNFITQSAEHVVSIEVLAKQFKVGDTVRRGDYAKLPAGTVVRHHHAAELYKAHTNRWVDRHGTYTDDGLRDDRTIAYLPDAS